MPVKDEIPSSKEVMTIISATFQRPEPVETPEDVYLNNDHPERTLKISSALSPSVKAG